MNRSVENDDFAMCSSSYKCFQSLMHMTARLLQNEFEKSCLKMTTKRAIMCKVNGHKNQS